MKKLYTTLALAAAVAFGASAVAPAQKALQLSEPVAKTSVVANETAAPMRFQKADPQKAAPANMDELCGMYFGTCQGFLNGWSGEQDASITLYKGEGENEVLMTLTAYNPFENIKGTVDFTSQTVSFPKQDLEFHTGYNEWIYLCYQETTPEGEDVITDKPCVFSFADGALVMESNLVDASNGEGRYWSGMLSCRISQGYFSLAGNFNVPRFVVPDFDLTGWTKVGTAKFQDNGWIMNGIFGTEAAATIPFQDVEYYTKEELNDVDEEMHTLIALYQPYAWFDSFIASFENAAEMIEAGYVNESEVTGAIVIDITFPQAIIVNQGNYCGFKNEGDYYWPYNQEYVEFYNNGFDADDIAGGLDAVSTYDEGTNIIEITNCYFGLNNSPQAPYRWVDKNRDPLPTLVLVQLEGDTNAINTIVTDNNAPVEYYNLQGQRVSENAKGLVIRKQGNNVAKVVR